VTETAVSPAVPELADDDLVHMFCCLEEVGSIGPSLCGTDVSEREADSVEDTPPEQVCVVCRQLDESSYCPNLGRCLFGAAVG
jgi:hypothetical protein